MVLRHFTIKVLFFLIGVFSSSYVDISHFHHVKTCPMAFPPLKFKSRTTGKFKVESIKIKIIKDVCSKNGLAHQFGPGCLKHQFVT